MNTSHDTKDFNAPITPYGKPDISKLSFNLPLKAPLTETQRQEVMSFIYSYVKTRNLQKWTDNDRILLDNKQIQCINCKQIKHVDLFHKGKRRSKETGGYSRDCRVCSLARKSSRTRQYKLAMMYLLGESCACCGYKQNVSPLQFHHVEGQDTKQGSISDMTANRKLRDQILDEIDKCCLLCSNCHSSFHGNEISPIFVKTHFGYTIQH